MGCKRGGVRCLHLRGEKAVVHGIGREDVAETRRDDHLECRNRPRRRPPPRGRSRCRNCAPRSGRAPPARGSAGNPRAPCTVGVEPEDRAGGTGHNPRSRRRHEARRDQLIGIDIVAVERDRRAAMGGPSAHAAGRPSRRGRTSVRCPVTAAAATIAGDIKVRARPAPLTAPEVPVGGRGAALAGLHADRRSLPHTWNIPHRPSRAPPQVKMRSSPSASACALTCREPGETRPGTFARRPARTAAAARRSSIRALVQEPMKTWSTAISARR
jgi:hypothetical protein